MGDCGTGPAKFEAMSISGPTKPFPRGRSTLIGLIVISVQACTVEADRYIERHHIKDLTIVFLDERSMHEEWALLSGRHATRFLPQASSGIPNVKTVKGFYDFNTNTLYCPKWNFEVCGHELHHGTLGQFHSLD